MLSYVSKEAPCHLSLRDDVIRKGKEGIRRYDFSNSSAGHPDLIESSSSSSSPRSGASFRRRMCPVRRPVGFKAELKKLAVLAVPASLTQFMVVSVGFVSTAFCGHLGKVQLDAVALATAVVNVTGISIGAGLASACDTLISQTYGARNLLRVGVILQRAILILILTCFPCWALLINTESILLVLGQEPEVARLSQLYVKIFMPSLPAAFMYDLQSRYLQNQGIVWPQVVTGFVVNLINALLNYIFLFVLNLEVVGSALAHVVSRFSMAGILFAYILWKGLHKATWGGWSKDCLQDWGSFIRLAIPSMVMMCVEWWTFEIAIVLAGLISEVELGAQSVIYELSNAAYMVPLGAAVAGSVRVGNALGAGDTQLAKLSAKLAMFSAASVALCLAVIFGSLRHHISYIFTYDEQIQLKVAEIIMFYAPFIMLDATAATAGGIIRGMGKQKVGALCTILGYYGVCLPLGVPLMFAAKLGIKGLWIGFCSSMSLQTCFLVVYLARANWEKVTHEAQIRAGVSRSSDPQHQSDALELLLAEEKDEEEEEELAETLSAADQRNLILRRGLLVVLMLVILVVGIVVNLLLTNHLVT
ncbi:multidrug and toxin extrusion protein 1-like isoform X2 [Festucalex cinctus]